MKQFLLMATMLLTFGAAKAQISDVQHKGNRLYVYGENNNQLSFLDLRGSDEFLGMGSSFYVVKQGNRFYTYDEKSKQIAFLDIRETDSFKSASGNSFNVKKGNRIYTYDKNCKQLSWGDL